MDVLGAGGGDVFAIFASGLGARGVWLQQPEIPREQQRVLLAKEKHRPPREPRLERQLYLRRHLRGDTVTSPGHSPTERDTERGRMLRCCRAAVRRRGQRANLLIGCQPAAVRGRERVAWTSYTQVFVHVHLWYTRRLGFCVSRESRVGDTIFLRAPDFFASTKLAHQKAQSCFGQETNESRADSIPTLPGLLCPLAKHGFRECGALQHDGERS